MIEAIKRLSTALIGVHLDHQSIVSIIKITLYLLLVLLVWLAMRKKGPQ